jgi:hypothetical protein
VIDLGRGCARFRPVLVDFVDHGDVRAETGAALAHLDRCARCTQAIESTMLTITALRRIGDEAAVVADEPAADAWPRLRVRIEGWRRPSRVMSPLAGIAMSFAIVTVLVVPSRFGGDILGPVASPNAGTALRSESVVERRIEADYIAAGRQGSLNPPAGDSRADVASASYPRRYPDNLRPTRKEVGPTEPSGRPSGAI